MNRILLVVASLAVISGLSLVHFSLASAKPASSPTLLSSPTPLPTSTPQNDPPFATAHVQSLLGGPVGSEVQAQGFNFESFQSVRVTFNGELVGTANANSFGFVQSAFIVPDVSPGTYQIVLGDTDPIAFIVTPIIHACSTNHKTNAEKQGQLRIVSDPAKCHQNETPISWNQP